MSKYTTEVRFICESNAGLLESEGANSVDNIIANSRTKIFDFDYPIFDEEYRPVLESKILKHYYTREICAETVGLWKLWLNARMNDIMPYYNKLYESANLEYNPLHDTDLTTSGNRSGQSSGNGTDNNTTVNSGDSWNEYSDTPQGGLDGIATHTYLTNATHDTSDNTTTSNGGYTNSASTTDQYIERVTGNRGGRSFSKLVMEYRETLVNIDLKIINELADLFFNLW